MQKKKKPKPKTHTNLEGQTLHVWKNPYKGRRYFWKVYDNFTITRGT